MATFLDAYQFMLPHEGGYAHDPHDPGGETYKGISRHWHPEWSGWKAVDHAKLDTLGFPDNLEDNYDLEQLVRGFYFENFWKPTRAQDILDQHVANKLFDCAVNCGIKQAVTMLQKAMWCVGLTLVDLDGIMGQKTLESLNMCRSGALLGEYRDMIAEHYRDRANKDRELMRFLGVAPSEKHPEGSGWLKRAYA